MANLFRCTLASGTGSGGAILVTCDSAFAGATITCTDGTATFTQTCPSTAPYTLTFENLYPETWTVSGTVSGTLISQTVEIPSYYPASLVSGFSWQTWVDSSVDLDSSDYSTLADLLADEEAIRELCLVHACVDYMCTFNSVNADLSTVINNDLFAKWVNNSDYALDKMYANVAIADEMDTADKYGYGEWCLMPQVPTMTSNTAPYGTVIKNSETSADAAYKAFDGDNSTAWQSSETSCVNTWIGYNFVSLTIVKGVSFIADATYGYDRMSTFKVQGSNDGFVSDIHDITSALTVPSGNANKLLTYKFDNDTAYSYVRIYCITGSASYRNRMETLQFYAWQPKGNVPVMTSSTAPYGTVSSQGVSTNYNADWKVFDGVDKTTYSSIGGSGHITYKFTNPVCVKKVKILLGGGDTRTTTVSASNDGSTFTPLATNVGNGYTSIDNDTYYLYYRIIGALAVSNLQFYGRELSVSVPTMTSDTAPYGEAFVSSTGINAYNAFDGNTSTRSSVNTVYASASADGYIGYHFISPVDVRTIYVNSNIFHLGHITQITVSGSNDGTTYDDLYTSSESITQAKYIDLNRANHNTYSYYKVSITWKNDRSDQYYGCGLSILQFYGFDYTEREFEPGATKKWLYDHGVELEPYTPNGSILTVVKEDSQIDLRSTANDTSNAIGLYYGKFDLTNYSLMLCNSREWYFANYAPYIGVANNVGDTTLQSFASISNKLQSLDISAYNSSYYVQVSPNSFSGNYENFTELWLE